MLGEGPRLLVFNGSGATMASTRPLIEFLAQSFEVPAHDQRGLGLTGLPSSLEGVSFVEARPGEA
ncbi:MAG: hypothetical protein WBV85_08490 [Solirubrobacteraceae bacterium]